jgi:hypothetical protein
MKNGIARIFLTEIKRQCSYSLSIVTELNARLSANNLAPEPIIRLLDLFLGDVSRVSLLLWPKRRGDQVRGSYLRKMLDVSDDNPLKDRTVRNAFQHMDERLDRWAKSIRTTIISDFSTLPRGFIGMSDDPKSLVNKENVSRHYYPAEKVLFHFGDEIDIERLVVAVKSLGEKVDLVLGSLPSE